MSSANIISNLENVSPSDGYENNDNDNVSTITCNSQIKTDDNSSVRKVSKNKKYLNKMLHLLKEFLIMVLVAVTYAAITNDPPKIGKSPAAYRFFPEGSHITDWYKGEISEAISHARSADIAFVMFYAPWDAESQHARREFQIVAKHMHQEVTFSAVNCWQPGSECKTQYSKVYRWPVLIAYPTHGRGIQYNGPLIAVYMMQFLKKVINPFTREIFNLQNVGKYEAVVVGKVNASPRSKEYNVFYQTILRLLEKDPIQEIGVSVQTQSQYNELGQANKPELILYMWNETLIYSDESEWSIDALLEWIMKNVHRLTTWVSPSGSKSSSLSNYLQPGPAFVFFTPKNPLEPHNDFYSMVREIAHEYNKCGDNLWVPFVKLTIRHNRREKYLQHLRMVQECSTKKLRVEKAVSSNLWNNISYCVENRHNNMESSFLSESSMVSFYGGISGLCIELLKNFDRKENNKKKCHEVKYHDNFYPTSKLSDQPDPKSPENLRIFAEKEKCRQFLIAQKYQTPVFSGELYKNERSLNITGLKCKTNKTLSFISMDSLYYHHFAEKLGIDLSTQPHKTAVVILDDKMESHYHMSGSVTESKIKDFIYNYTVGSLPRALSSSTNVISKNTHSYSNDHRCSTSDDTCVSVKELNSANFLRTVSQNNKAVIIFYYSKQCSFCNGLSYRFLTVAKYFSSMDNVQFARINGELNLLPWEYTMETYPTILFVPPKEKSESRVFPMDMPITVPNLLGFIMANLKPLLKLEVMWTLCRRANFYSNITECSSSLRHQTTYLIDKALQRWRFTPSSFEKAVLFKRLQCFHDLYFLFMENLHDVRLAKNYFDQLKTMEFSQAKIKI